MQTERVKKTGEKAGEDNQENPVESGVKQYWPTCIILLPGIIIYMSWSKEQVILLNIERAMREGRWWLRIEKWKDVKEKENHVTVRYWFMHWDQENEARGTGNVAEKKWQRKLVLRCEKGWSYVSLQKD